MRVLVIGGGAREHAITARLAAEAGVTEVICAPGNPGISAVARIVPVDVGQPDQLLDLAVREGADLTVVGPELPLTLGIADRFLAARRALFGPTAAAARLESSKAFAKAFMARHGIPTARFRTCDTRETAKRAVRSGEFGFPVVLKADGLAAGKGVVIAADQSEADAAITAAMEEKRFGTAGTTLVVEECLSGPEVSFFVVADGERALPIGTAQDHKRIFDDDRGPNTGGMGAFAPSPLMTDELQTRVMREIVEPTIRGLAVEGCPFRGFLYIGLMISPSGPKVIEFNVRLGDPEAQVILPLVLDPLVPILMDAASGSLRQPRCQLSSDKIVGVVLASRGYPESTESGAAVHGVADAERLPGVTVYYAGTERRGLQLVNSGGRVLTVVGRADNFTDAIARAYAGVRQIAFDGMQYRRDIGRKALTA